MVTSKRLSRFKQVASSRQPGAVVLENISDPYNAGAVFRSCDAFGIHHVHLVSASNRAFDPLAIGLASSGTANQWLCFHQHGSIQNCLHALKSQGYTIFATVLSGKAQSVFDTNFDVPFPALLFGNEHSGLSETALEQADRLITIPMRGVVQSLNVSVSAAVCLFELTRQRQAQGSESIRVDSDERQAILSLLLKRHNKRA